MSNNQQAPEGFLDLSSYLTGFSKIDLLGTGMLDVYFNKFVAAVGITGSKSFWQQANAILGESQGKEAQAADLIRQRLMGDPDSAALAKKIIIMWYTGSWPDDQMNSTVISAEAYMQSLMWTVFQAHVPGARQPGYGSWSLSPDEMQIK
jgi:Membrane bound FAD containing D-sorbitol dehydrogenase